MEVDNKCGYVHICFLDISRENDKREVSALYVLHHRADSRASTSGTAEKYGSHAFDFLLSL